MTTPAQVIFAAALASATAASAQNTGPSSSASSYLTPTATGWSSTSVISVGDKVGDYRMVGIPDGLGAYDNGDGTITVLMNHELRANWGIARAHGSIGAFVSEWKINKNTLQVTTGKDLVQSADDVNLWHSGTGTWVSGTTTIGSLCSADLPSASAFYNRTSGNGYNGRIFMNGEEVGAEGRAFAFVATGADAGKAYELPKLGKFSRENSLANPLTGDKTVVIGTDDSTPGQVYVYVGTKQASGNSVERAGLTNGTLSGIKVSGITLEKKADHDTSGVSGGFTTVAIDTTVSGAAQQTAAATAGVTEFARPEDGAWVDADTFVFVTTGTTNGGSSKLYKVDFADDTFSHGTVSMVLNSADLTGTDGQSARSFDNITVGLDGNIYIQEDPGDSPYIAKTWQVDLTNPNAAVQIFESDQARFLTPTPPFSQNEEHSGIIDVTDLFAGASWYVPGTKVFLADTQAHYAIGGELVEGGQLSLLTYSASAFP